MKNLLLSFLFTAMVFLFVSSCKKEDIPETNTIDPTKFNSLFQGKEALKHTFSQALAKTLTSDATVRAFIKAEALKQMDQDYDVLYELVKDDMLPNGKTLRGTLLQYFNSEADLAAIEKQYPLLTIFVPQLPENSFSAATWNTQSQVPEVAIRLNTTNEVPMIKSTGEEYVLEAQNIPGFPVVVVKENERMVSSLTDDFNKVKSTRTLKSKSGIAFKFIDDAFDKGMEGQKSVHLNPARTAPAAVFDKKLIDAYLIYKDADGWQRDYVYYGITPASPNGEFSYDFREHITSFRLQGQDALATFKELADHSRDPGVKTLKFGNETGWTDGQFELWFTVFLNGFSSLNVGFAAGPEYLFNLKYQ